VLLGRREHDDPALEVDLLGELVALLGRARRWTTTTSSTTRIHAMASRPVRR
jgi:hypothetical protein